MVEIKRENWTTTSIAARVQSRLRSGPIIAILLFLAFIVIRLPFLSQYPVNWDSVQYLMGIDEYDLQAHQPHPPGYLGYIMLGRAFTFVFGDPHLGLVMLSVLSGAVATAAMFGLARCWLDRKYAVITAVIFGSSPLVWYYSEVALNYIVEAALVIPFAWLCYRARTHLSWRDLMFATVILAMLGAIRQSGFVLLVPLWLYTAWAFPWRQRFQFASFLGVLTLAWLIPLLWMSGGPITFWEESRALGSLVSNQSTVFGNVMERVEYFVHVAVATVIGLTVALVILLAYRNSASLVARSISTHDRRFFVLWAAPSLATYIIGHMGQFGYVLTIIPILFLWVGATLSRLQPSLASFRYATPVALAAVVVVANTFTFLTVPSGAMSVSQSIGELHDPKPSLYVRQYDIRTSDAYWDDLVSTIEMFPPESTAVLATIGGPRVSGGYRHLSYYLPEFEVYGMGVDGYGAFGKLFETRDGASDYSIAGLEAADPVLVLPDHIRYVVTADIELIEQIPDSLEPIELSNTDLVLIRRPFGMNFAFLPDNMMVACHCDDLIPSTEAPGLGTGLDDRERSAFDSIPPYGW